MEHPRRRSVTVSNGATWAAGHDQCRRDCVQCAAAEVAVARDWRLHGKQLVLGILPADATTLNFDANPSGVAVLNVETPMA